MGYKPASPATIEVPGEAPQQVAVDQSSGDIYVAIPLTHFAISVNELKLGQIDQLTEAAAATAASPFAAEQNRVFTGVAVDPVTHGIYALETAIETPIGSFGTAGRMDEFSSTGSPGTEFSAGGRINEGPRIAADSSGRVFVPSAADGAVLVYDSSGVLQETIACDACSGGPFEQPTSVALDSADDLYVVDVGRDEVVKLTDSGAGYEYSSTLQSGKHAGAVAVDPSTGSVFVGDYPGGTKYHIVAYDSSGERFDDFGAGLFASVTGGAAAAGPIAVNAATHRLYVSDPGANVLRVFDLGTINPPSAATSPATPVGQVEATAKATVNANFDATYDCHFEYVDESSFQSSGFGGASSVPCSSLPDGSSAISVSAQLSSLSPASTYHYRIVATNDAGTATGGSKEFTTLAVAPATAVTEPATAVNTGKATLHGTVNAHGGTVTSCLIEYGPTETYGKNVGCPTPVGIDGADVSESVILSGLAAGTTYHYRLAVTTNAGSVQGGDVEFATLAPPSEEPDAEGEGSGGAGPGGVASVEWPAPSSSPTAPPKKRHACRKGFRKARVHGKQRCVKKHRARRRHRKHRRHHRHHIH